MKEKELRERATCGVCGRKIGASGMPIFWVVRIESYCLKQDALQRQQGLGMFLGHGELARIMGPDEDLAEYLIEPVELTVCGKCGGNEQIVIAVLTEKLAQKSEQKS
jgi:hypothetical protein